MTTMPEKSAPDMAEKLQYLMAENNSLSARLNESYSVIASREKEIEILLKMLSESTEMRSLMDQRLIEMQDLQMQVKNMKIMIAKSMN